MAEEQACLVRARSDSENSSKLGSFGSISRTMAYTEDRLTATEGAGEPGNAHNMAASPADNPPSPSRNESGELLDYNDSSVLEQFHEDALRQAGCGLSQARVALGAALALAGAALELSAAPLILPSAEIELCVRPHEKNWLVLISLVGLSLGAMGWGPLGERLGRRRTLMSSLAVNAVFATIAAVMPTYGTFMMARFCSGLGSGGIIGTSYTYLGESVPRPRRRAAAAALALGAAAGAAAAAALARALLPDSGADALNEDKEHFSAWHRYLLFCTLPILASLISLIWTQESPRYLLEVGREVDAMGVYQSIHSSNQVRLCGRGSSGAAAPSRLHELQLPGKRRPPAPSHVRHSVKMFWQAFFQLFSNTYRSTTLSLGGILLFTMAIQLYLSGHVPARESAAVALQRAAARRTEEGSSLANARYNHDLENVRYLHVSFTNCTFRDMLMSHVQFVNCTFGEVAFENIKTSYTSFEGCQFYNSTIIDTDMEIGRELDEWCTFNNTTVRGMTGGCARHADLTFRLAGLLTEQSYCAHGMLLCAALAMLPHKCVTVVMCAACVLASPSIYFVQSETALYIVEAVYRFFTMMVFYIVCTKVVDSYPANLRCTAHGLFLSVAYMGGALFRGLAGSSAAAASVLTAALGAAAAALAVRLR